MKKLKLLMVGILVTGLLFSTAVVLASPAAPDQVSKPGKTTTPGARATEQASARATDQPGRSTPGAKATEKAVERDTDQPGKGKPKGEPGELKVYQGIVAAVGSQSLALKLPSDEVVTFVVSDTVKVNVAGLNAHAQLSDVPVGARALVQARQVASGLLTAVRIHAYPPKPERRQRVGIVTAYTPGVSITIQGPAGLRGLDVVTGTEAIQTTYLVTTATVILPAERASQLAVGMRVTIIAPNAVAKGSEQVAQGIVIHPASPTPLAEPTATK